MTVREAMGPVRVTVGLSHTLGEAARRMTSARVGSAIVLDPKLPGPGILTERDLLRCAGEHGNFAVERVADYVTEHVVYAAPEWALDQAAEVMITGGFRHLIVIKDSEAVGVLSMRDIVRCWITNPKTRPLTSMLVTD
ncbi:MAG: CBS domain-containing protein [Solirubrobacteraceae bacterium]|jgi:CBS domain-containing protein